MDTHLAKMYPVHLFLKVLLSSNISSKCVTYMTLKYLSKILINFLIHYMFHINKMCNIRINIRAALYNITQVFETVSLCNLIFRNKNRNISLIILLTEISPEVLSLRMSQTQAFDLPCCMSLF